MERAEILNFWFGGPDSAEFGQRRKVWFFKDPAFDAEVHERFAQDYAAAAVGRYDAWRETAHGALALIILLDQFPRNMFRDTARAFAADKQALQVAKHALAHGFDRELTPYERLFAYLPFEHSENLEDQDRSLELMGTLEKADQSLADVLDYAQRHRAVIARFGRFPHRNRILGRESTPEEITFLGEPGSSF
jgi:uncharacterized protein (DUF924 family)